MYFLKNQLMMDIFIRSASQISFQQPLDMQWLTEPIFPSVAFNPPLEPDYKQFVSPVESRRMGHLLKRAVAVSLDALRKGECSMPDAVISGTGLGCIENTEKFLNAVIDNEEECLPPTPFMQSTHNTVSSQIALKLQCHGYNSTYSHRGTSFDSALLDAVIQLQLGQIRSAIVGGYDEMTPAYFRMLNKLGYWRTDEDSDVDSLQKSGRVGSISGSSAVSLLLTSSPSSKKLCQLYGIEAFSCFEKNQLPAIYHDFLLKYGIVEADIDAVMCGFSGDDSNDEMYRYFVAECCPQSDVLWYKHLFGESFCASAFGVYAAACCLHQQKVPTHLYYMKERKRDKIRKILVFNCFQNIDGSLILLSL